MKRQLCTKIIALFSVFLFSWPPCSFALSSQRLTDRELDQISAQGFDINIDAALAFRQAVAAQNNIAAIGGPINAGSIIGNYNTASVTGAADLSSLSQENIAAVVATEGDLTGARVSNENYASLDSLSAAAQIDQRNMGMLIALNGNIVDSNIYNLNDAAVAVGAGVSVINQQNIAIVIASGAIDAIISNVNRANVSGNSVVNSGSEVRSTFSTNGFSGMVTVTN